MNISSKKAKKPIEDHDDLFEMVNLRAQQTSIEGTIYISSKQSGHAPRVKYFAGRAGNDQPSMSITIALEPEIEANSLPEKIANKMAPIVISWVKANYLSLRQFWFEGNSWYQDEVSAFVSGLHKWTPPIKKKR